ncbi:DddA-like double-stranded DNA deaminase toxin [Actinosynnema sp. ALI-1.44]|uniref:DddA-like double-stranded DNA deaminase toxin n=1 Tax=Actinosynnema sp. ALI-1.44 TaxID=1933779 RepID=UPI00143D088D|nr:DddA-like double-stranded DNA deaminase toxin [Actinosynnema sp. ALI-1.44]
MSVDELRAQVQDVITRLANARNTIGRAAERVDEACSVGQAAFQGSTQPEAVQYADLHAQALSSLSSAADLLNRIAQDLAQYITNLGASDAPSSATPRSTPAPATSPDSGPGVVSKQTVERIRAELPPPVVTGSGAKTHGRLIVNGKAVPVVSGEDQMAAKVRSELTSMGLPVEPTRATDVDMKTAAWQRTSGTKHATVVINHVPCKGKLGCDQLVPILLPEGYTLTVHGETANGVKYKKRFSGGAAPWWS